jgi:ParB/RepB/Spo0J family partition protein
MPAIGGKDDDMGLKQISEGRSDVFNVPLSKIKVIPGRNPRTEDLGDLHMLAMQLIAEGQRVPVTVRYSKEEDVVEIVDGERRFRAALLAKKDHAWKTDTLKCITEAAGVTEDKRLVNILLANEGKAFTPMERAGAYLRLIGMDYTPAMIAASMGCSTAAVKGFLALAKAPEGIQKAVRTRKISKTVGLKAAKAKPEKQQEIIDKAEAGEKIKVKDVDEHRTQFSAKEIEAALETATAGTCHDCPLKKDLIQAVIQVLTA